MNLRREEIEKRYAEFPDQIRLLGYDNAFVKRVMDEYAHGGIILLEEALCRMVVGLAEKSDETEKRMIEMLRNSTFPVVAPFRP